MPDYTISCVIPTYNRAHLVCDAIDSALSQTYPCHEIIVVDDGSTDNTEEVLRERYGDKIIYLKQENAGPAAARNRGIEAATGEWIAFLDSDDLWLPEKSERQVDMMKKYPECSFYFSNATQNEIGKYFNPRDVGFSDEAQIIANLTNKLFEKYFIPFPSVIISKALLCNTGLLDIRMNYGEDMDLCIRLDKRTSVACTLEELVKIRRIGNNLSKPNEKALLSFINMLKRIIKDTSYNEQIHLLAINRTAEIYFNVAYSYRKNMQPLSSIHYSILSISYGRYLKSNMKNILFSIPDAIYILILKIYRSITFN